MALEKQFAVLHLTPTATQSEVRRAYRRLMMVWHPDRFARSDAAKRQEAHERTKQLVAAYAVLREHFRNRAKTRSATPQTRPASQPKPVNRAAQRPRSTPTPPPDLLTFLDRTWMAVGIVVLLGGLADLLLWLLIRRL